MQIKKILLSISIILVSVLLVGCTNDENNGKLNVITTVFPSYDFVREVAEEEVNVELLMKPGTDFHTYEPTPQDIIAIEESDVFIYVGTETWAVNILDGVDTSKVKVIRLMDYIELEEELVVEGMEHDHDHDHEEETTDEHDHDHDHEEETTDEHDHDHEEEVTEAHDHDHEEDSEHSHEDHDLNGDLSYTELLGYDEHIWTSIKNSEEIIKVITDVLVEVDSNNESIYKENSTKYLEELSLMDEKMEAMIDEADSNYIVVADRFPFTYFVNDYGLEVSAAFTGCSTADSASSQTIAFLIDKVNTNNIPVVFHIEASNESVADAIVNETDAKKLELHSAHNITVDEFEDGMSYLDFMESNYNNLKEALN